METVNTKIPVRTYSDPSSLEKTLFEIKITDPSETIKLSEQSSDPSTYK
jgi:hypothetical protein